MDDLVNRLTRYNSFVNCCNKNERSNSSYVEERQAIWFVLYHKRANGTIADNGHTTSDNPFYDTSLSDSISVPKSDSPVGSDTDSFIGNSIKNHDTPRSSSIQKDIPYTINTEEFPVQNEDTEDSSLDGVTEKGEESFSEILTSDSKCSLTLADSRALNNSVMNEILGSKYETEFGMEISDDNFSEKTIPYRTADTNGASETFTDYSFRNDIDVSEMGECKSCCRLLFKEEKVLLPLEASLCSRLEESMFHNVFCRPCAKHIQNRKHPKFCYCNNLDPGDNTLFKSLNFLEQRIINLVNIFMTIIVLPGGQYAEKGNCVHFPNDFSNIPEPIGCKSKDTDVLLLSSTGDVLKHDNFIRCKLLKLVLTWLFKNNILFKSLGNNEVPIWILVGRSVEPCNNDAFTNMNESGFVQDNFVAPSFDALKKYLKGRKLPSFDLSKRNPSSILSMFSTKNLEEKSFVHLFPSGCNGFHENRALKLSFLEYVKLRLMSSDSRWRKTISYIFWALNTSEQERLQSRISFALRTGCKTNSYVKTILNDSSYTFFRNFRGSVGYWHNILLDLLAMIRCIGPPHWFLTLSADDLHWNDVQQLLVNDRDSETNCADLLRKNPVLASFQLRRRWFALMRWLKKSKVLGTITDTFERVEFQDRGSGHLHIFIWTAEAPDLSTPSGRAQFPDFLDKYVSTKIPESGNDRNSVLKYQIHHHTDSCTKGGHTRCRFGFPRPARSKTQLVDGKDPLSRKRFYETERRAQDVWVNPFCIKILRVWKANMDIQFVGHAFGVAAYVCSYIAKSEPKGFNDQIRRLVSYLETSGDLTARKALSRFGTAVLTKRVLGASEATFKVGGIELARFSRKVKLLNCRPSEDRFRVFHNSFQMHEIVDMISSYDPKELQKFCYSGFVDLYCLRPDDDEFEGMTLAEFASWYEIKSDRFVPSKTKKIVRLQNGRVLLKRTKMAPVRTNPVSLVNSCEDYYFRLLMLHYPFRKEEELRGNFSSFSESFKHRKHLLSQNSMVHSSFSNEVERAIMQLRLVSDNIDDLMDEIVSNTIKNNMDNEMNPTVEAFDNEYVDCGGNESEQDEEVPGPDSISDGHHEFSKLTGYTMTDDDFLSNVNVLNSQQRQIYDYIRVTVQSNNIIRLFVSGSAGSGKSFLIAVVYEMLLRLYNSPYPTVLKCAFTGVASANISGQTLHRTLILPVDHRFRETYRPLEGSRLHECRQAYWKIKFLIIDEISMVSYRCLENISRRLSEIKENNLPFGGIHVLCLGDFFQLRPVCDSFIFARAIGLGSHLWRDLFSVVCMTINMRQGEDKLYADMLNRIRIGEATEADLALLESRLNAHLEDNSFCTALRTFSNNKLVNLYNHERLEELRQENNVEITTIVARDSCLNTPNLHGTDIKTLIPKRDSEAGGLTRILRICEGARVMLIRNISVESGLVNGAMGFVSQIVYTQVKNKKIPDKIVVTFDGIDQPVEILPMSVKYFGKGQTVWERTQFPLRLCWACTIHKVQGLTLDKIVIDLHKCHALAMGYVALSRVRSLQDVSFIRFSVNALKCSKLVKDYYATLSVA